MDVWIWRWRLWGGWLAGFIGAILAWFAGFDLVNRLVRLESETLLALIWVLLMAGGIFAVCLWRVWATIRKERYANITRQIHAIMHQLRDLNTFIHEQKPRDDDLETYKLFRASCQQMLIGVLDQVNAAFISLTSNNCRTAIKLLYEHGGEIYVYTFARDTAASKDYQKLDNNRVRSNHDPLSRNFQFARLASDQEECWHFQSSDLTKEKNFTTSSASAYDQHWDSTVTTNKRRWPLPYRSTITCVIRQAGHPLFAERPSEVLGYVTVDCRSRGVFEARWDVELLYAVADAMYAPIRAYSDAINRARGAPGGGGSALAAPFLEN